MVKNYQRYQIWREGGEVLHVIAEGHEHDREEDCPSDPFGLIRGVSGQYKRSKSKLSYFLFLSLLSCCLILAPQLLSSSSPSSPSSTFSLLNSWRLEDDDPKLDPEPDSLNSPICSSVANGTICCDRSSIRSDVCKLTGDIRIDYASSSIFLYSNAEFSDYVPSVSDDGHGNEILQHEKIRPYTRKWETSMMMNKVSELDLIVEKRNSTSNKNQHHKCDVNHDVPAVFFSTGGYTGNVYHDINDGILPLYITSQRFNRKVVFVILDFHEWWLTKYGDVLSRLSDYPVIDFAGDKRTHCFPEAIVGLKIHDELAIDPSLMEDNKTIVDFRNVLDRAYWPRIKGLIQAEKREGKLILNSKPRLAIISRKRSREITNENALVKMAEEIGFSVTVVRPEKTTELAKMYRVLNSSDVMIGVHGAAMTYFLFMKPESVFIQIIPLGLDWPSENYYGEPSRRLGLKYAGYKILPKESSLYTKYGKNDPVLTDPDKATGKNWELTKKIYLDHQNVRLNLPRFRKRLARAYDYALHHGEKALAS